MRKILYLIIPILLASVAFSAEGNKKAEGPLKVPADAVKVDNLTHRHTDAEGKTWIYRQTPFGLVRYEAEDETAEKPAQPKASASSGLITAVDEGDSVRFEKQSPFGKHSWVRKKTELNEEERQAWQRALDKSSKNKKKTDSATQE